LNVNEHVEMFSLYKIQKIGFGRSVRVPFSLVWMQWDWKAAIIDVVEPCLLSLYIFLLWQHSGYLLLKYHFTHFIPSSNFFPRPISYLCQICKYDGVYMPPLHFNKFFTDAGFFLKAICSRTSRFFYWWLVWNIYRIKVSL